MPDKNRALAMAIRAALLAIVDALEEWLDIERTKSIRQAYKDLRRDFDNGTYTGFY